MNFQSNYRYLPTMRLNSNPNTPSGISDHLACSAVSRHKQAPARHRSHHSYNTIFSDHSGYCSLLSTPHISVESQMIHSIHVFCEQTQMELSP
jgi:hypothetical protein